LHYGLGVAWTHATAISLAAIALQTPTGVLGHARRGAVDWRLAAPLALGGLLGVAAGDRLEPHVAVPWLKVLFAVLMGLAAWRLVAAPPAPHAHGRHPALLLAVGVAAGIVSQLLGIGGGLLTVPVLALLGVPIHVAVGTSLVPVFTNAALATAIHLARHVPLLAGVVLGLGSLLGVPLGVRIAHGLPERGLRRVFAGALTLAAVLVAATSGLL
jgi:uncharacterized membrane protein YfcA